MSQATTPPEDALKDLVVRIANFEAAASVANTGTGARREGEGFEKLLLGFWDAVRLVAVGKGAVLAVVGAGSGRWAKLTVGTRALYLPCSIPITDPSPQRWLDLEYFVRELVAAYPTEAEAIERYSPKDGPYAGDNYPTMFAGLTTKFDAAVLLEEAGVLKEKILLEYKTAKSSAGGRIDGNAHERLTFQVMQYLEIATRYPRCSLVVIANSAFTRYRNKYHVNFHVQADRLANFKWFTMKHICAADQYLAFAGGLLDWLFTGNHRDAGGLP
jgi:hypothetical protein